MTTAMPLYIYGMKSLRPAHEILQIHAAEWLAAAHSIAERTRLRAQAEGSQTCKATLDERAIQGAEGAAGEHSRKRVKPFNVDEFSSSMKKMILRFGCNPEKIHKRGHAIADFNHFNFENMIVYRLEEAASGVDIAKRGALYQDIVRDVFRKFYENESLPPNEMIHVSCTGYVSPSAAQQLVSQKRWQEDCQVTHAYHMGCYASIPAIRMAQGYCSANALRPLDRQRNGFRVDIVHTELCTLHLDPSCHEPEQLVVQSLFADGYMRYSVGCLPTENPAFEVLAVREEVVPSSTEAMTWNVSSAQFRMTLARDVPSLIAGSLTGFLSRMCADAGFDFNEVRGSAWFAIHPGGPKIIEQLQSLLEATMEQVRFSTEVLFEFGNMSSATLPHVWDKIARSERVPSGSVVLSMAFGPGLTMSGCLLKKC